MEKITTEQLKEIPNKVINLYFSKEFIDSSSENEIYVLLINDIDKEIIGKDKIISSNYVSR